jgi:acyl-coenzyme A synthetase/AMP-(fatty) acid ligase/acyl carrier protein
MQETYQLSDDDCFLARTSLNFDPSVWEIFWPLSVGASVCLTRQGGEADAAYLIGLIKEHRVTSAYFVPPMLRAFLDEDGVEECTTLRRVICGGESLSGATMRRFHTQLGWAELHHSYGPTEASIAASEWECERGYEGELAPIGRALGNVRIEVLDGGMGAVPVGVGGEMYIGGEGVGRGYLKRPALTAERFIPDPFSTEPGRRLYRTGDIARHLPDGAIEFIGRVDEQVKVRGYRIELGEIEAALCEHASVREAVAVAREDVPGDRRLVAYVVAQAGAGFEAGELRGHLRAKLPEYMVPSAFIMLDVLPLMPNGKVDRRALPAPDSNGAASSEGYVEPRTVAEGVLADIWAEVLGLERVGVEDDFFALGGHSLLATQVISRIREAFQCELPLRTMFEAPTVAGLVEHAARRLGGADVLEEIARTFNELKHLSEDEVRALLAGQSQ